MLSVFYQGFIATLLLPRYYSASNLTKVKLWAFLRNSFSIGIVNMDTTTAFCKAFTGQKLLASGSRCDVACAAKKYIDGKNSEVILIFDRDSSVEIELNLQGSLEEVMDRYSEVSTEKEAEPEQKQTRSRGRPKLGVVGKEVTLLPRHWQWLQRQSGGPSVALRKLVEQAKRESQEQDSQQTARDAVYNFMFAIAGNSAGFEEANRALYANDRRRFNFETELWPEDIKEHLYYLADKFFSGTFAGEVLPD